MWVLLQVPAAGPGQTVTEPESDPSRKVASALAGGKVDEAERVVRAAVAEYPPDASLRRREAQVFLSRAFEIGGEYETITPDLTFVAALDRGIERLR